jgi:hypothetical protein
VKICIVAILIAELENKESGIVEVNIGGKLMEPKMVMASRKRKVAATILGNLAACPGGGCSGEFGGFAVFDVCRVVYSAIGLP